MSLTVSVGHAPSGRAVHSVLPELIKLTPIENQRTGKRVIVRLLNEPGSDRVGQNVSNRGQRGLVVAKDMIEVSLLPECPILPTAIAVRGSLLHLIREGDEI